MTIDTAPLLGGADREVMVHGGLRARVVDSTHVDVEVTRVVTGLSASNFALRSSGQGSNHTISAVARDATNHYLWHITVAAAIPENQDLRLGVSALPSALDQPNIAVTQTARGVWLSWDGGTLTAEEAEYEEHVITGAEAAGSGNNKPSDAEAPPSGAWTVVGETPETVIASRAPAFLDGPRVMDMNGTVLDIGGFYRDRQWTYILTARTPRPNSDALVATAISDAFRLRTGAFDRSGSRRGGIDYGGRTMIHRYSLLSREVPAWGASGANWLGVTWGLEMQDADARASWHAARCIIDIPIGGGSAGRIGGARNTNALSHVNVSYEVTQNWSRDGATPRAWQVVVGGDNTPGFCRWQLINVYPNFGSGTVNIDELEHVYGAHTGSLSDARLNGGGATEATARTIEGYRTGARRLLLRGHYVLLNAFLDVSIVDRNDLEVASSSVSLKQDVAWRIIGTPAGTSGGKLTVLAGSATTPFASAAALLRVALTGQVSGTAAALDTWKSVGATALADNRRKFFSVRRADLNFSYAELPPDTLSGARSVDVVVTPDPAFTGTISDAAGLASKFTVDATAKKVTVGQNATLQEIYNHLKHIYSETDSLASAAFPATLAGGTLTMAQGWAISVADGARLSGTDAATHVMLVPEHDRSSAAAWSAATTYQVGAIVTRLGGTYRAIGINQGVTPRDTDPWENITEDGVLELAPTGSTSGFTFVDANGRSVLISTEPGATVIRSRSTSTRHLYYATRQDAGTLQRRTFSGDHTSLTSFTGTRALSGVQATEDVDGLSWDPSHRVFIAGMRSTAGSRIGIFDINGALTASVPVADGAFTSVGSVCMMDADHLAIAMVGSNNRYRVYVVDPSPLFTGAPLDLASATRRDFPSNINAMAWTGTRLLVFRFISSTQTNMLQYDSSLNSLGNTLAIPHSWFPGTEQHIGGAAVVVDAMGDHEEHLLLLGGAGGLIDAAISSADAPHTVLSRRTHSLPTARAYVSLAAFDLEAHVGAVTGTASGTGELLFTAPATPTTLRVTAKKAGYDARSELISTAGTTHALSLTRNPNIDLSIDISDYDLSTARARKSMVLSFVSQNLASIVQFGDTYDLKGEPEKSKRLLDALLSTASGVGVYHSFYLNPSLNNGGRVVSFHPTYVNILPGWLRFQRASGLATGARAVFGSPAYIGDGETFYRPPEVNGGHVEIADPATYVQFDSARTRTVSREIIEEPANQEAIADAFLSRVPEDGNDNSVGDILYGLRDGAGGAGLTENQAQALNDLYTNRGSLPNLANIDSTTMAHLDEDVSGIPEAAADATHERQPMADDPANSLGQRIRSMDSEIGNLHRRLTMQRAANLDNIATRPATSSDIPSATQVRDAFLQAVPPAQDATYVEGSVARLLADGLAKAKRLDFDDDVATGPADVKATLDMEAVTLPSTINVGDVGLTNAAATAVATAVWANNATIGPNSTAVEAMRAAILDRALTNYTLGGAPATIGDVIAMLSRVRLLREGTTNPPAYSVVSRLEDTHRNVSTGLSIPSAGDVVAELLGVAGSTLRDPSTYASDTLGWLLGSLLRFDGQRRLSVRLDPNVEMGILSDIRHGIMGRPTASYTETAPGGGDTMGKTLADAALKARRLKFKDTGTADSDIDADVQNLPTTYPASLSPAERTSLRTEMEGNGSSLAAIKEETDKLSFTSGRVDAALASDARVALPTDIETQLGTIASDAAGARKGVLNTAIRSGADSTLRVKDDDGSDLAVYDLLDPDGAPARTGASYTRRRRAPVG